jgi:diguanylate cyclase (GGDEF)-like protein
MNIGEGDPHMELQYPLLAGMIVSIAGIMVCLVVSSRSLTAKSKNLKFLEGKLGELNGQLLKAKLEKSQAVQIAERIPVIMKKMTERLPVDSYPPIIVRYVKTISIASQVGYFVPLKDTEYYTLQVGYGFPEDWKGKVCLAQDDGALGQAIRKRIIITREDAEREGIRTSQHSLEMKGIEPDFVAPVYGNSGIEGILVVAGCPTPSRILKIQISMLVDLLSLAIQNAILLDSTERGEHYDYLTGLANRFYFSRTFETEIRKACNYLQSTSLLFFDIDHFKSINDTLGHQMGDLVLQKVAKVAKSCTRSDHLIARYGGDEFIVLLPSTNKDQAFQYAEKLREAISKMDTPIKGQTDPSNITISVGISMFPADGRSTSDLVRAADEALYEAKNLGKNRIVVFPTGKRYFDSVDVEDKIDLESSLPMQKKIGSA